MTSVYMQGGPLPFLYLPLYGILLCAPALKAWSAGAGACQLAKHCLQGKFPLDGILQASTLSPILAANRGEMCAGSLAGHWCWGGEPPNLELHLFIKKVQFPITT